MNLINFVYYNPKTQIMKILRKLLFGLLGLVLLFLVVALFAPKYLEIVSETEINLPVNKVFYSQLNFIDRGKWDPWISKDTTTKTSITLSEDGVGSVYSWTSEKMGSGKMVVDSVVTNQHIALTLSFAGMNQSSKVWNDFSEKDGKTLLKWGFYQDATYPVGRIFMLLMKGKLQSDYDQGLANLKKYLEENGVKMSSLSGITTDEISGFTAITISDTGTMEKVSARTPEMFGTLLSVVQSQGLEVAGYLFSHYSNYDEATGKSDFEVGIPVKKAGKTVEGVKVITVAGFRGLKAIHTGPYEELSNSYEQLMSHIATNNVPAINEAWEFYLTDPEMETDPTKWKTLIVFPMK